MERFDSACHARGCTDHRRHGTARCGARRRNATAHQQGLSHGLGPALERHHRGTKLPNFIDAKNLEPFISDDLLKVIDPVEYRSLRGQKISGFRTELLPLVCDAISRRDPRVSSIRDKSPWQRRPRSSFEVSRRSASLHSRILERFIAKELQLWVHTFPAEFYEHIFRLRGLEFPHDQVKRP